MAELARRVAKSFAAQYIEKLIHQPEQVALFYANESNLTYNGVDTVSGPDAIKDALLSLKFDTFEVFSLSGVMAPNDSILIVVDGSVTFAHAPADQRRLTQTFFLHKDGTYKVASQIITAVDGGEPLAAGGTAPAKSAGDAAPSTSKSATSSAWADSADSDDEDEGQQVEEDQVKQEEEEADALNEETEPVKEEQVETPAASEEASSVAEQVTEEKPPSGGFSYAAATKRNTAAPQPKAAPVPRAVNGVSAKPKPASDTAPKRTEGNAGKVPAGCALFVKDVEKKWTEEQYAECFKAFGPVLSVDIPDGKTFAFVNFTQPTSLIKALESQPVTMLGKTVVIEERTSNANKNRLRGGIGRRGNSSGGGNGSGGRGRRGRGGGGGDKKS